MTNRFTQVASVAASLAIGCIAVSPGAFAQNPKPPKTQLWMDVSTGTMAGMPEMDMAGGGPAACSPA